MKTLSYFFLTGLFLLQSYTDLFSQGISINIDGSDPNSASILDIKSTNKGVLLPRLTTSQRTADWESTYGYTLVDGLTVYDTDTKTYWYYNSTSWKEIGESLSSIKDSDNDTKIEVEQSADLDQIIFTTFGNERMRIDESGNTYIGNATDYIKFESNGSLTLHGAATVFDDLLVPVTSTTRGGSNDPSFSVYKTNGSGSQGVFTYWFSPSSEQELYFVVQMPHAWLEGSDIFPHVHWLVTSDLGSANVEWGLEYTWINIGETYGNTTIISAYSPIAASAPVTANKHALTQLPTISGTGKTLSSMLLCRVFRKVSSVNDTYPGSAALLQIDFHYEMDGLGSRTEFIK